jgi:hypothetical protein
MENFFSVVSFLQEVPGNLKTLNFETAQEIEWRWADPWQSGRWR